MKISSLATIAGLLLACSTIGAGAYTVVDTRNRVILTAQRLDQKILQDKIDWCTNKINELLDQYKTEHEMPPAVRAWFRDLIKQLEAAKRQLNNL